MGYVIAAMIGSGCAVLYFIQEKLKQQNASLFNALTKSDEIIKVQGDELERRKHIIEDQEQLIQYQGDIINKHRECKEDQVGEGGSSSAT